MYRGRNNNGRRRLESEQYPKYLNYLRQTNQLIDDDKLRGILNSNVSTNEKRDFLNSNPPLDPDNVLKPVIDSNREVYLLNTVNRRNSSKISPRTGNLVGAMLSQGRYDQLFRLITPEQPAAQAAPQQAVQTQPQQVAQQRAYWQQPAPTGDVN